MASTVNWEADQSSIRNQLMCLTKTKLTKICKSNNIQSNESKECMINALIAKHLNNNDKKKSKSTKNKRSNLWNQIFATTPCSIYKLCETTKQWLDKGKTGQLEIFQNLQNTKDLRAKWSKHNQQIWLRLINSKLKAKGDRAWVTKIWDVTTNKQEIIAIRFKTIESCQQFAIKYQQIFPQKTVPGISIPFNVYSIYIVT